MSDEVKKALGYGKEKKTELNPLDEEKYRSMIKRLNNSPIEVIQKRINNRIVDFEVKATRKANCPDDVKDCQTISTTFKMMVQYDLKGFGFRYGQKYSFHINNRDWFDCSGSVYNKHFLGRKAGHWYMEVKYIHHLNGHPTEANPFAPKYKRSPFNLHLFYPDQSTYDSSLQLTKEHLDQLWDFKKEYQPTIENHNEFIKNHNQIRFHSLTCKSQVPFSQDYCDSTCMKKDILDRFLCHPHYYYGNNSFCFGNMLSSANIIEAKDNRNPFSYINALIYNLSFVASHDCQGSFEYFTDVFHKNYLLFDNKYLRFMNFLTTAFETREVTRKINPSIIEGIKAEEGHLFCLDCFCLSCLAVRGAVDFGLKFDPNKVLIDKYPAYTLQQINILINALEDNKQVDRYLFEEFTKKTKSTFNKIEFKSLSKILSYLTDIDLHNDKYYIVKSTLDYSDSVVCPLTSSKRVPLFYDLNLNKVVRYNDIITLKEEAEKFKTMIKRLDSNLFKSIVKESDEFNTLISTLPNIEFVDSIDDNIFDPYFPDLKDKVYYKPELID